MIKTADNLLQVAAKSDLMSNRVNMVYKKVYVHKMFQNKMKDVYLPCVTLSATSIEEENNRDYNNFIRPFTHEYDVFLWTRATFGRRAWKSM